MRVLITGGNGFLASHLIKFYLKRGAEVVAVVRAGGKVDRIERLGCQIVEYSDVPSLASVLTMDTVVLHVASYYVAEHRLDDVDKLVDSNIRLGLYLLEAMKLAGCRRILSIGTAWQSYGEDRRRPVNLYAFTKQAFEDALYYYSDAEGFGCVSLRLNDTYGADDDRIKLVKLLIKTGIEKKTLNMSLGHQKINLTSVEDVCRAIYQLGKEISVGLVQWYTLVSEDELSIRGLHALIQSELGLEIDVNWGGREYRAREVMEPSKFNRLDFNQSKWVKDEIKLIYQKMLNG